MKQNHDYLRNTILGIPERCIACNRSYRCHFSIYVTKLTLLG